MENNNIYNKIKISHYSQVTIIGKTVKLATIRINLNIT